MRLTALSVENFRAITRLRLENVHGAVVLAGPNGCGKSCVLDAVRLLKSAYGSYAQDEWQMWFGESQIQLNREFVELLGIFQDRTKPVSISASFALSDREKIYLRTNLRELLRRELVEEYRGRRGNIARNGSRSRSAEERDLAATVDAKMKHLTPAIESVDLQLQQAELLINPTGEVCIHQNLLLELLFSVYDPQNIGVLDYHSASRTYNRQRLDSVNLNIHATEAAQRQHALYNSQNKYSNLKTEMTSAYVRSLLAREADSSLDIDDHLTNTLKELFSTFFQGKEFLGPQPTPDGRLTFLVKLRNGAQHDIDDLSSGEKEVVYGYLRLHSSAPRDSMIMIDEPELHLNPKLVSGLAAFYYRHLGARFGNQLWLVTHSDTLIREAVAHPNFSVYHIQPATSAVDESQATLVKAGGDVERLVLELVGDLAAYRPGAKVVIFESTNESAFDVRMTSTLFPEFDLRVNKISGGAKRRVADLYAVLEQARIAGHLDARFFSVVDADGEQRTAAADNSFQWDRYHIENYLLEPKYIQAALLALGVRGEVVKSEESVIVSLREVAKETVHDLVAHRLRVVANSALVSSIDLRFDSSQRDSAAELSAAILRSRTRIDERLADELAPDRLNSNMIEHQTNFEQALADGTWISIFRGRDILKRFARTYVPGMAYEYLRDLIIHKMAEDGYQPAGMKQVVDAILKA